MTIRGWLLSHFCAALFGFLLAVFFFSGDRPEQPSQHATEQLELEIQELKARLLSYQELRQRLDERIAYLLLKPSVDLAPTVDAAVPAPPAPARFLCDVFVKLRRWGTRQFLCMEFKNLILL